MKKNYVITNEVSSEWIQNVINLSDGDVYPIDTGTAFAYMVDFSNLRYGRVRRHCPAACSRPGRPLRPRSHHMR